MATSVTLAVPDEVVAKLSLTGDDISQTLRLAAAFSLCNRGELTVDQGAQLAGLTYDDFLQAAVQAKVELFPVDIEELKEEITQGFTLGRRRASDPPPAPSSPLIG